MNHCIRKILVRILSLTLLVMLLLPGLAAATQSGLTGLWKGVIDIPGSRLAIEVALEQKEDLRLEGCLSIPAHGVRNLPFTEIETDGSSLTMTIEVPGGAIFSGKVSGTAIEGTYVQSGQSFPFSLQQEGVAPPEIDNSLKNLQGLDDFINKAMDDWDTPGTAVAVVYNGEVIYGKGFGWRDMEQKLPVTIETQFGIGSSTKAFTAALLGMLADEQQLDWDTPVKEYIPGFAMHDLLASDRVTLRDLATHRIGLPRNDFAIMFNPGLTRGKIAATLKSLQPNADFRTMWQYNNLGYIIAGHAAERVTGQTWEDLIRQRILVPLGMQNTTLSVQEMLQEADYALPYAQLPDGLKRVDFWELGAAAPCGAINSSVLDMAEWLKFQLNNGAAGGKQLLSDYQLSMMHSPQIPIPAVVSGAAPVQFSSYGLGWMVESYRGHYVVQHGGNVIGHTAQVTLLPEKSLGIVVLSNAQGTPVPTLVAYNILDRMLELQPLDLGSLLKQQAQATSTQTAAEDSTGHVRPTAAELLEYEGCFNHPFYGDIWIRAVNGELQADYYGTEIALEHQNHDTFAGKPLLWPMPIPFQFQRTLAGNVEQVSIGFEPAGAPVTFVRQAVVQSLDLVLARKLAGQYLVEGAGVQISFDEGRLTMLLPGQPLYELQPIKELTFSMKGFAGYTIEFVIDKGSAKVTGIIFSQPNGVFRGHRVN